MAVYDVAVIGLGTMGSLTALELTKRGQKVIGFDSFSPPHDRGSHSGDTRIFRTAYSEHPNYVPLALRAGTLWERLGEELEASLLNRIGMLTMGEETDPFLTGIRGSAALHQLPIETLSAAEIRKQFPALYPSEAFVGILEKAAGWVDVNASLQSAIARSRSLGACLEIETQVFAWEQHDGDIVVRTKERTARAKKLIVTAGAWSGTILSDLHLALTIRRKVVAWFVPGQPELFRPEMLPVFAFTPNLFYGFPNIGDRGVKVAEHHGGEPVLDLASPVAPPGEEDLRLLTDAATRFLPALAGPKVGEAPRLLAAKTCLYTLTPDEHFVIDQHPWHENVFFAAGFSGHGFKFAPVVAEILSDLALEGRTTLPVEFLRLKRLLKAQDSIPAARDRC
jgi:monomeric sarcosine oxidase